MPFKRDTTEIFLEGGIKEGAFTTLLTVTETELLRRAELSKVAFIELLDKVMTQFVHEANERSISTGNTIDN